MSPLHEAGNPDPRSIAIASIPFLRSAAFTQPVGSEFVEVKTVYGRVRGASDREPAAAEDCLVRNESYLRSQSSQ